MRSLNSLWGVTILLALTWAVIFVVKIIEPAQVRADSDCYEKCVDPGAPPEEWWECKNLIQVHVWTTVDILLDVIERMDTEAALRLNTHGKIRMSAGPLPIEPIPALYIQLSTLLVMNTPVWVKIQGA